MHISGWPGWWLLFSWDVDSISDGGFILYRYYWNTESPKSSEFLQTHIIFLPVFPLKVVNSDVS